MERCRSNSFLLVPRLSGTPFILMDPGLSPSRGRLYLHDHVHMCFRLSSFRRVALFPPFEHFACSIIDKDKGKTFDMSMPACRNAAPMHRSWPSTCHSWQPAANAFCQ